MQRTTGSAEELQKSHVLQLTRCYAFLQVLVISLWPLVNGFPIFFLEILLISIWFYDFSSQNLFFQFKAAISYFPAIQYSDTRDRGN